MSDYYCTNCGADLGNQYGFDPEKGYWTCTVCGTLMTDPDDPDFDTPSGATWFCDGCGACLNKQSGFSEYYSSWTCTECGHDNRIDESEIYDSEEDYQRSKEEYDDLGDDYLYDHPHRCESCGKLLNRQSDYSDYFSSCTCEKCGTWNTWDDEDEDDDSSGDSDDDDSDDDESYSGYSSYSSDSSSHSYSSKSYVHRTTYKRTFSEWWHDFLHKLKIIFFCTLGILILIGGIFVYYKADAYFAGIPIGVSAETLSEYTYDELKQKLLDSGYKFVSCTSVADLEYSESELVNHVAEVSIGEVSSFSQKDKFSRFSRIVIQYHILKIGELPVSAKDAKGQNYEDVVQLFKEAGFGNIELQVDYDIVFGFLAKENTIESITVNGDKKFSEGYTYSVDVPVVITYHAKSSDKPN